MRALIGGVASGFEFERQIDGIGRESLDAFGSGRADAPMASTLAREFHGVTTQERMAHNCVIVLSVSEKDLQHGPANRPVLFVAGAMGFVAVLLAV